ncbi:nickel/cobalt efflux protein RcnA [Roseomonas sp. GC11]|uniref:HoxN/HupN/NixA family nickel/cobalt transporter n=1 Tax=Roseomonas sp. GC11 TaxID=2950546 RepID=UPI00210E0543|nr:nickel/cobalt efflux protein RcnA [Roseomonas sp. GC11]MCQ4159748.1 nickel/cobalt efflux protein RcnA [Roseomonas sp. GC11]
MTGFADLLREGSAHAWLFIPSAILLGALHGLEPGHSKTMMAAFIIAIRGSIGQAVLLGLAAAFSHTLVVWVVALLGLHYAGRFDAATAEPYFQLASGLIVIGVALWMLRRIRQDQDQRDPHHHHAAYHHIPTPEGELTLEIFEDGVPPRWRLHTRRPPQGITLETLRPDGTRQGFTFTARGAFLESREEIPEPHAFTALLRLAPGEAPHRLAFAEDDHHHGEEHGAGDAHARAHAAEIERRFAGRAVTTPQIALFGLTGGLIPCPAAITVLLLCLQLREFALGATLVTGFSIGLAAVMVTVGVAAAVGVRQAGRHWSGLFDRVAARAPYASAALILLVGLYMGWSGWAALA